jgi:hypothetical protein
MINTKLTKVKLGTDIVFVVNGLQPRTNRKRKLMEKLMFECVECDSATKRERDLLRDMHKTTRERTEEKKQTVVR